MALAKAVVTGTVVRKPETRFTQNDVSISSFVLDIGEREEMLIRILSMRKNLEDVISNINQGDKVLVEGRLQIPTVKNEKGAERKIYEINANTIELISGNTSTGSKSSSSESSEEIVKFSTEEFTEDLIQEDEIPF